MSESNAISKNGGLRVGGWVAGQMAFLPGDVIELKAAGDQNEIHSQTQASENLLVYAVKHGSE